MRNVNTGNPEEDAATRLAGVLLGAGAGGLTAGLAGAAGSLTAQLKNRRTKN